MIFLYRIIIQENMWTTYETIRKHPQDFDVYYKLYCYEDGGRKNTYQGLRCDFLYADDDVKDGIYMIHPEFENDKGEIIIDTEQPVPLEGTARMWIISDEMRVQIHRNRIKIGLKGFMMEGSRKIGEVEVIRIVGLYSI